MKTLGIVGLGRIGSTVARMAGNIAPALITDPTNYNPASVARQAVDLARVIIAETKRTEPTQEQP